MIVNVAYTLIFNTGLFPDACRAWQSRAIAGKRSRTNRATQERDRNAKKQDQACMAGTTTRQNNKQRQLLLVAWLPGGKIAHKRNMQYEKERTLGCSEQEQHHGWSTMGQGMMRRGS
jgi:hypothetical protein